VAETTARIDRIGRAVRGLPRPRVVALEWLDPVYVAGHWTPELIELAVPSTAATSPSSA